MPFVYCYPVFLLCSPFLCHLRGSNATLEKGKNRNMNPLLKRNICYLEECQVRIHYVKQCEDRFKDTLWHFVCTCYEKIALYITYQ